MKPIQFRGKETMSYNKAESPLPTAEGAEEITAQKYLSDNGYGSGTNYSSGLVAALMTEFATLHAQRIAEKMVSERLREELIAYDRWMSSQKWGVRELLSPETTVNEYLKTRDSHETI